MAHSERLHAMYSVKAVYNERQFHSSVMIVVMLFSLKTMESLQNGLQPQSETLIVSMRTVSLAINIAASVSVKGPLGAIAYLCFMCCRRLDIVRNFF